MVNVLLSARIFSTQIFSLPLHTFLKHSTGKGKHILTLKKAGLPLLCFILHL